MKGDLETIVMKALRREPQERYATVEQVSEDLENYLGSLPIRARKGDVWYQTRKFLRRYWVTAAAIALVVASLLSGLYIANRQRVVAERRFEQLRQLSKKVIDLDAAIRMLPGSVDGRRRLVSASLEYLEGLSREAHGNLDLAQEVADGYWRMARIQGGNLEFNLGDPSKAEDSWKKADLMIELVLRSRPQSRSALFRSALIAQDRMILADTEERRSDVLVHARKSVKRLEEFLGRDDHQNSVHLDGFLRPGDPRQSERGGVALLYSNIALTYVNNHLYADGERYARRSAAIAAAIPSAQDLASGGLSVLANALRYQGKLETALTTIRQAREIAEKATYQSDTAHFFHLYGTLLREGLILGETDAVNLGRPAEAIEAFTKALAMIEEAARRDANDAASRARMGTTTRELGDLLRDRDPRQALAIYDLGIQRLGEIRNSLKARRDRAVLLAKSSYALRRLRRGSEAKERIDAAFAILKDTKDYPAERILLGSHAYTAVCALADHEAERGDPRQALEIYRQCSTGYWRPNPTYSAISAIRLKSRVSIRPSLVSIASPATPLWQQT